VTADWLSEDKTTSEEEKQTGCGSGLYENRGRLGGGFRGWVGTEKQGQIGSLGQGGREARLPGGQ
jgi:hypothetical protein